jgi:DNA adenine methylase
MHYLGSKARHAKDITAITLAGRRDDQTYVEPFVGGGNVINIVPQGAGRIANDKNVGMVALLDCLGNRGWVPPETMTKSEWAKVMKQKLEDLDWEGKANFAFQATGPTFGSMWAGQWAKDYPGQEGTRYRQARDAALRDAPGLTGIVFHSGSYADLEIPERSLVYCDPPYVGTTDYAGSAVKILVGESGGKNNWKAAPFWKWCDRLIDERGCSVFVSEYKGPAPGDVYGKVWEPAAKAAHTELCAKHRALQADDKTPTADIVSVGDEIRRYEDTAGEAGRKLAERWKVVWSKEVISDFSASRGKGDREEDTGKVEIECLFHRE